MSKFEDFGKSCAKWFNAFSNRGQKDPPSTEELIKEQIKKDSDREVEATLQMVSEKDPVKKMKMENRIANGIYDFSDL